MAGFSLVSLATLVAFHGAGEPETAEIPRLRLQPPRAESLNRFSLSARTGFNIQTEFRDLGPLPSLFPRNGLPQINLDGEFYNYDNGYVYPDAGTPNSGLTHYWGYSGFAYGGDSQLPGDGTILMQRALTRGVAAQGLGVVDGSSEILPGLELAYNRELGRDRNYRWGLEAAFNYMNLCIRQDQPLLMSRTTTILTDVYPLLVPEDQLPPPGYEGRKDVPGVVIGASPQSSSQRNFQEFAAGVNRTQFDANVFGFRLGPYMEYAISPRLSLGLSAGLSLAYIASDYSYTQSLTSDSGASNNLGGSGSHSDLLAGGYIEGTASYALTRSTGLFAGVQYQDVGRYTHTVQRREAALDMSRSVFVTVGLTYSF